MIKFNIYLSVCLLSLIPTTKTKGQDLRAGIEWEYETMPGLKTEFKFQFRNFFNNHEAMKTKSLLQAKVIYEVIENLNLASSLRYAYFIGIQNQYEKESPDSEYEGKLRLTFDINYKTGKLENDFKFSNRLRYQNTILEDKEKPYLRNKIECNYKITKNVKPFFAVEPFYNPGKKKIDTFRIYFGSDFEIFKKSIVVYLLYELKTKQENLCSYRIFGITYKF